VDNISLDTRAQTVVHAIVDATQALGRYNDHCATALNAPTLAGAGLAKRTAVRAAKDRGASLHRVVCNLVVEASQIPYAPHVPLSASACDPTAVCNYIAERKSG